MRIPIPSIAIPVVVLLLYFFIPGMKERPWTALRICGAVIAAVAYIFVTIARVQLGKSFTVKPQARALVTHGLYSRIRNPIYLFVDLMLFGLILMFDAPWLLLILPIPVISQTYFARREAALLQEKFGQAYVDYRRGTWF